MIIVSAGETDGRKMEELEKLIWDPECKLSDKNIDQFLVIARFVFFSFDFYFTLYIIIAVVLSDLCLQYRCIFYSDGCSLFYSIIILRQVYQKFY
jgi:hypothetical protein